MHENSRSGASDVVGEFPNLRLTPEKEAQIRAQAEERGHNGDAWIAMLTRSMNDPVIREDMEHTSWHVDTKTPFDGSCPQGCKAEDPKTLLDKYRRGRP
jgi:hypothetical protein